MSKEVKIKVNSTEMTQFEKDLYRLAMIEGRFYYVYQMMRQIPDNDKRFYSVKSSIREYGIIQLHNFLNIRDSIRRDLRNSDKENVEVALRPLWKPIDEQREAIKQLRDEYLAHLQDDKNNQFNRTIEQILHDSKFSGSWNDIAYYAGCVLNYCVLIKSNFEQEWFSAQSKYMLSNISKGVEVLFKRTDITHIQDVDSELKNTVNSAKENLKNKNFKYTPSSIEKLSFSYTEDLKENKSK